MFYAGKSVLLASKHGKEQAIAPPFKKTLNCDIWAPDNFDTDKFGTFTGEIQRSGSQHETLILKAKCAGEKYGVPYVIASEGSFGPHPMLYFFPGSIEMLTFIDLSTNFMIVESQVSQETNYAHIDIHKPELPESFLKKTGFPGHALIVRIKENSHVISKGIQDENLLLDAIKEGLKNGKTIRLETDMRAHLNPTRMKTLIPLATRLAERVAAHCPSCQAPGFGEATFSGHLPCDACRAPTELYEKKILNCLRCDFKSVLARDDGLLSSPQQYCPICNP